MRDFSIVRLTSGETLLCILSHLDDTHLITHFPMLVKITTIPIAEGVMREMHTSTVFCPFTDDKSFTFPLSNVAFIKPMNQSAVPYYVDMLNSHEEPETLEHYGYSDLVKPDSMQEEMNERSEDLLSRMEEIENDNELDDVSMPKGNRTLH